MRNLIAAALVVSTATAAAAQEPAKLTIEQCLTVLAGLNALNCRDQMIAATCDKGAPQYSLGPARLTVALAISALANVANDINRAQQQFVGELPTIPPAAQGKQDEPEVAARRTDQAKAVQRNWNALMTRACPVSLPRLKMSELGIGDGPGQNQFPPGVLGAIAPMIDQTPAAAPPAAAPPAPAAPPAK